MTPRATLDDRLVIGRSLRIAASVEYIVAIQVEGTHLDGFRKADILVHAFDGLTFRHTLKQQVRPVGTQFVESHVQSKLGASAAQREIGASVLLELIGITEA